MMSVKCLPVCSGFSVPSFCQPSQNICHEYSKYCIRDSRVDPCGKNLAVIYKWRMFISLLLFGSREVPVDTLSSGDTYQHPWTRSPLLQEMACCLIGVKPLPNKITIYNWTFMNKFQLNKNQNTDIFI